MPIEVHTCYLCGSPRYKPQYRFVDCQIVRCVDCQFMWLTPQPTHEDVLTVYNDTYFNNDRFLDDDNNTLYGYVDYMLERLNKQVQYQRYVRFAKKQLEKNGISTVEDANLCWLDIGCGLGYLIDTAFDYGFKVVGSELNPYAIEQLRERYNYRIESEPITHPLFDSERFDVISMTDVIEHLHDPREVVQRMYELTKPGGIAIITTMDSDSLTSRLLGKRLEDFRRTREHLYFFARPTLARLLEEAGYQIVKMHSIGHTFELGFLADRLKLIWKPLGRSSQFIVNRFNLQNTRIYINPRTKMVVYAYRPK